MSTVRVAALQMRSGMDVDANVRAFEDLVREAADAGAIYVQSPEMTGAVVRGRERLLERVRPAEDDPLVARASELARELSLFVHVGSTAIALGSGKVANRAFLFGPDGETIATYDKIHMFDVDLDNGESWRESETYAPGSETVVASLPFAKIGLSICYDLRFPQLFKAQALAGAQVLTVPAAFTRQTGEAHWDVLTRARAIENGAWLIAAAQGGKHEDGRETYGHSIIVDPWGRVVAQAVDDAPTTVIAEIEPDAAADARAKIPNLKNAREFAVTHAAFQEGAA